MIKNYKGITPKVAPTAFVAENALIIGDVEIGDDSGIWFNVVVRGDTNFVRIGKRTNIQDGSILHVNPVKYPLIVGDNITVGHRSILHGCTIKDGSLVGIGAIVLDGALVGEESIIGAGSLVAEGTVIPPRTLAMGIPAKAKRELTEKDLEMIRRTTANYAIYKDYYRDLPR